jgi:hypothetical protein
MPFKQDRRGSHSGQIAGKGTGLRAAPEELTRSFDEMTALLNSLHEDNLPFSEEFLTSRRTRRFIIG